LDGVAPLGLSRHPAERSYRIVAERTARLREANGHTVFLRLGDAGVTIVRWLNGVDAPMISFRLGSTLPLQRSATGRLYLVYLPKKSPPIAPARASIIEPLSET